MKQFLYNGKEHMKVLVTGGAGFIGANFILYWLRKYPQDSIINIDKLTYAGNLSNLLTIEDSHRYSFVKADICNRKAVEKAMQGVDIVVHFAAESHVDRSFVNPFEFMETNVHGTHVLLDAAVKEGVKRFHHVSTDEVFGMLELGTEEKFDEHTNYDPRSPYAASKASSDHLVRAYHTTYGLPITITNCSNNYGPYQFPEKIIPLTITSILEGKKIPIHGDGLQVRDWLYVEDHCRAIDSVLKDGKPGETYLVGGVSEDVNVLQVVTKIATLLGVYPKEYIHFVADRKAQDKRYAVDWSYINKELGWEPLYDLDTWLEKTVIWYQKNEWWWKDLKKKILKEQFGEMK